jgi:hypothetical protein
MAFLVAHRDQPLDEVLSPARYRAPTARLASDLRIRRARAASTIPRSLSAVSALLLSVLAVRAGV